MSSAHAHAAGGEALARSEPTNTKTVRRKYAAKLRGRYAALATAIREGVVDRDVFRLRGEGLAADPIRDVPDFPFDSDSRKQDAFMSWLRQQEERGILNTISRDGNTYIQTAYKSGIRHADGELYENGYAVPDEELQAVFNRPLHRDTVELLYSRNFEALKGINDEVAKQIGRELSDGLTQGHGPRRIAESLTDRVDKIGKTRATTLARTEVLNAHNSAAQRRYGEFGVEKVDILGFNPCKICAPIIEKNPHPLDDLPRGGPPFHPNCVGTIVIAN